MSNFLVRATTNEGGCSNGLPASSSMVQRVSKRRVREHITERRSTENITEGRSTENITEGQNTEWPRHWPSIYYLVTAESYDHHRVCVDVYNWDGHSDVPDTVGLWWCHRGKNQRFYTNGMGHIEIPLWKHPAPISTRYALSVDKKPTEGWWDRRERSREGNTHGLVKVQPKKYPILEDMALIFDWKMYVVDKDTAWKCAWKRCSRELKKDKATIKLQADQSLCVGHKDWKLYLTDCKHPVIPILEVKEVIIPNVKVNID